MTGRTVLTRSHADIVQGKLGHSRVELEQQGQRLANATSSTEDGHLGQLQGGWRVSVTTCEQDAKVQWTTYLTSRCREGTALEHGGHSRSGKHLDCLCIGVRNRKAGDLAVTLVLAQVLGKLRQDGRQAYRQETRG